ncbi:MAG: hypothetical protein GWP10_13655 [Nitrospiraceae bacterium]|nr:hypothetical protein [Nitrospiraceae bacterium]
MAFSRIAFDNKMDAIREYRRRETWGNAYRKPNTYAGLNSREVREPFLRSDSRR